MKHLKTFNESVESDIDTLCEKFGIKNYTVNSNGSIDVKGDVNLANKNLAKLPITFSMVGGSFYCQGNKLESLVGSPKEVVKDFDCSKNKLKNLKGSPSHVRDFDCSYNKLETLVGSPSHARNFDCRNNQLTSLKGLNQKQMKRVQSDGNNIK
jgi:hypothetical protein